MKATGEGLAQPPEQVEVAVAPSAPPALRAVRSDARRAARWSLRSFSPVAGYTAALAVEGPGDFTVVFLEPARRRLGSARPPTQRDFGTATAHRLAGPASRTSGSADYSRRAVPGLSSQYAMSGEVVIKVDQWAESAVALR